MADHALVLGVGQRNVVERWVLDVGFVVEDDPRALAEAKPLVVIVLQTVRNPLLKHVAVDGLQHTCRFGALEPRCVHGQQNVRRRIGALGLHACDQFVGIAFDPVDRDAGRFGEVRIEPFVGIIVARRIEVHFPLCHCCGAECGAGDKRQRRSCP